MQKRLRSVEQANILMVYKIVCIQLRRVPEIVRDDCMMKMIEKGLKVAEKGPNYVFKAVLNERHRLMNSKLIKLIQEENEDPDKEVDETESILEELCGSEDLWALYQAFPSMLETQKNLLRDMVHQAGLRRDINFTDVSKRLKISRVRTHKILNRLRETVDAEKKKGITRDYSIKTFEDFRQAIAGKIRA